MECFENGIITTEDTGGLEMTWGDARAIIAITEMLVRREGFGDVIADGVKIAAERIGKGSERYAMHIGGQEIAAHDPRGGWGFATGYGADPTPGRHNQGGGQHPPGLASEEIERSRARARALSQDSTNYMHAISALGMCQFVIGSYPHADQLVEALKAIAGWQDITTEELLKDRRTRHQHPSGFQHARRSEGSLPVSRQDAGRPAQRRSARGPVPPSLTSRSTASTSSSMDWDTRDGQAQQGQASGAGTGRRCRAALGLMRAGATTTTVERK